MQRCGVSGLFSIVEDGLLFITGETHVHALNAKTGKIFIEPHSDRN